MERRQTVSRETGAHEMNDKEREADRAETDEVWLGNAYNAGYRAALADRAVPEPDADAVFFTCTNPECDACEAERDPFPDMTADAVERAAKAIHRRGPASGQDFRYRPETEQEMYRDMARAAIAAAGPETDWLDAALGSVHPEAAIECWFQEGEPEVGIPPVTIAVVREPGGFNVAGYGDTSSEAIRNAIANALAAKQEGAG